MDAIPQVIFNLLIQQRQVILPGLGTLFTEQLSARYDASPHTVTVPRNKVVFTAEEKPGETLSDIIARQSQVPLKDVKPQVNRWIARLKKASADGLFTIDGVGGLIRQPGEIVCFEPSPDLERVLNPIDPKEIRLPLVPPEKKISITAPVTYSPTEKKSPDPHKTPRKKRSVWWIILPVAFLILAGGGYYANRKGCLGRYNSNPERNVPLSLEPEIPTPTVIPDVLPVDSVPLMEEEPLPGASGHSISQEGLPQNHNGEVYHLIAGVFSNRENAERYVRENTSDPAHTELIPTTGGRFMVSVGKYAEKTEADRTMSELQKTYPQIWISKRKK